MKKVSQIKIKPKRDWLIIVAIFGVALLVISIVAWQIYLSNKIGGGYVGGNESPNQNVVGSINHKKLNSVVNLITDRKEAFSLVVNTSLKLIDPSK